MQCLHIYYDSYLLFKYVRCPSLAVVWDLSLGKPFVLETIQKL